MSQTWKTIIIPKYRFGEYDLKELWGYRDLCFMFVKKNYITRYKQTIFGPLYIFLGPILTSGLFSVIFGTVAGINTNGVPTFLFYMISNLAWGFFSGSLSSNKDIFTGNAYIMGKVYFPRLVVPISNLITSFLHFLFQLLIFVVALISFKVTGSDFTTSAWVLLVPFIFIELGIMGLGAGLIVSSLSIRYKDISVIVGFGMSLLMYATPVIYPLANLSDPLYTLMLFNPVAMPLEVIRYAFFRSGSINIWSMLYSVIFSLAIFFVGTLLFNKVEKTFIDTI